MEGHHFLGSSRFRWGAVSICMECLCSIGSRINGGKFVFRNLSIDFISNLDYRFLGAILCGSFGARWGLFGVPCRVLCNFDREWESRKGSKI